MSKTLMVVAIISIATTAYAQTDITGQAVWFGNHKSEIGAPWDQWYSAGGATVTVGRHWTPHLRAEVGGTATRAGRIYGNQPVVFGDRGSVRPLEYQIQSSSVTAGVTYQFFENQWFHPFVGTGLELVRERQQLDVVRATYAAQPFVRAGFKAYVSPRAFVRTDVMTSVNSRGVSHVSWSGGVGVELSPVRAPQARVDDDSWRAIAQRTEVGTPIALRLQGGRRLKATLISADDAGIAVQPRTRVPVGIARVPYSAIVSFERDEARGMGAAKAVLLGAAAGGGTFLGLLMLALSSWD